MWLRLVSGVGRREEMSTACLASRGQQRARTAGEGPWWGKMGGKPSPRRRLCPPVDFLILAHGEGTDQDRVAKDSDVAFRKHLACRLVRKWMTLGGGKPLANEVSP